MKVVIDGEPRKVVPTTFAGALRVPDYADATVITALNGKFVPRSGT